MVLPPARQGYLLVHRWPNRLIDLWRAYSLPEQGWGTPDGAEFWSRKRHERTLPGHKKCQPNTGHNGGQKPDFLTAESSDLDAFEGGLAQPFSARPLRASNWASSAAIYRRMGPAPLRRWPTLPQMPVHPKPPARPVMEAAVRRMLSPGPQSHRPGPARVRSAHPHPQSGIHRCSWGAGR